MFHKDYRMSSRKAAKIGANLQYNKDNGVDYPVAVSVKDLENECTRDEVCRVARKLGYDIHRVGSRWIEGKNLEV